MANVGRPGRLRVENLDGSMRVFTREKLTEHLTEAITFMAANGKTEYDDEVMKACKTQGETERVNEAVCLHKRTIADLLQSLNGKGLFETSEKE